MIPRRGSDLGLVELAAELGAVAARLEVGVGEVEERVVGEEGARGRLEGLGEEAGNRPARAVAGDGVAVERDGAAEEGGEVGAAPGVGVVGVVNDILEGGLRREAVRERDDVDPAPQQEGDDPRRDL